MEYLLKVQSGQRYIGRAHTIVSIFQYSVVFSPAARENRFHFSHYRHDCYTVAQEGLRAGQIVFDCSVNPIERFGQKLFDEFS